MLLYDEWSAYWPQHEAGDPFADFINNVPKYVVSSTLSSAAWQLVVDSGQRLFDGTGHRPLKLVRSETFGNGVLDLRYVPAG